MYCKKCGHKVAEGDKFCSTCGSKVEDGISTTQETGMDFSFGGSSDVDSVGKSAVFQFFDRTGDDEQPKKPTPPTEDFDWNIHTFPGRTIRKTEDVNFRWTASALKDQEEEGASESLSSLARKGLMERDKTSTLADSFDKTLDSVTAGFFSEKTEKQKERPGTLATELNWDWTGTTDQQEVSQNPKSTVAPNLIWPETGDSDSPDKLLSAKSEISEPKKEKRQSDKFFTFHQKNEEFQKLLDQEYEKIKSGNILSEEMHTADAVSEKKFAEIQPEDPMEHLFATEGIIKGYQPKKITTDVLDRIDAAEAQKTADKTYRAMMEAQQEKEENSREMETISFADVAALMEEKEQEEEPSEESVAETIASITEFSIADLMKQMEEEDTPEPEVVPETGETPKTPSESEATEMLQPEEPAEVEEVSGSEAIPEEEISEPEATPEQEEKPEVEETPESEVIEHTVPVQESTPEQEEEPPVANEPEQTVEMTAGETVEDLQETEEEMPASVQTDDENKPEEQETVTLDTEPEVLSESEPVHNDAAQQDTAEPVPELSLEDLTTEESTAGAEEVTDAVPETPVLAEAEIARLEAEEAARKAEAERAIQQERQKAEQQKAEAEAIQRAKIEADAAIAAAEEKAAQARAAAEAELRAQEQRAAAEQARLAAESRKLKERHTSAEHLSEMALAREAFFTSEMPAVKAELPPEPDGVDLSLLEPVVEPEEPQLEEISLDGLNPEPELSRTRTFNKEAILAGMAEATRIMAKDKAGVEEVSDQQDPGDDVQVMDLETLLDDQSLSAEENGAGEEASVGVPADTVVMSDDMFSELLGQASVMDLQTEPVLNTEETEVDQEIPEGMDLEGLIAEDADDGEIQIEEEENILDTVFVDEEQEIPAEQESSEQTIQDEFYQQIETDFAEKSTDITEENSEYLPMVEETQDIGEEQQLNAVETEETVGDIAGISASGFYENDYEEESGKSRIVLKILLVILILLLLLEVAGFAVKIAAPTSGAAAFIDTQLNKIIHLFTGEDTDYSVIAATEAELRTESPTDKTEMIQGQMSKNKNNNIQNIKYNAALAFDAEKTYEEGELELTQNLTDILWYKDAENRQVYYDEAIIGTIIAFESQKMEFLNDQDPSVFSLIKKDSQLYRDLEKEGDSSTEKQTFRTLEIGEIREAGSAFYIWVSEDIDGAESDDAKEKVYMMEPDGKVMKVTACYNI